MKSKFKDAVLIILSICVCWLMYDKFRPIGEGDTLLRHDGGFQIIKTHYGGFPISSFTGYSEDGARHNMVSLINPFQINFIEARLELNYEGKVITKVLDLPTGLTIIDIEDGTFISKDAIWATLEVKKIKYD